MMAQQLDNRPLKRRELPEAIDFIAAQVDRLSAISSDTFTPFGLVDQMLDDIPSEFFCDKDKTFLEPSCGRGIFGLMLLKRLFAGLADSIPDEQERIEHILNKQIFMADKSNVMRDITKAAFVRVLRLAGFKNVKINLKNVEWLRHNHGKQFDVIIV